MTKTKVSVIVPVYNVERFLTRCLDSLVNQTLTDIEIICIDDGSTDSSGKILNDYANKDNRIKVLHQNNLGVSEARNTGIKLANGEYIGFVDSDDFIDNNFYEELYASAQEYSCNIACGSIIRENEKKKKKVFITYKNIRVKNNIKEVFETAGLPNHCYIWNKIYKRDALVDSGIKFLEGVVYEDMLFTPQVLEKLGEMVTVPQVYYHYWINNNSIVKTPSDKNRADKIKIKKELIKLCSKYNVALKNKDHLVSKHEYFLLGIKVLKVYEYSATKIYSLFGILPLLKRCDYI